MDSPLVTRHSSLRIGLLGGSFNPAHAGHLHLSLEALKRLGLDEVWWLVSPQNPLKSRSEMADYALRVKSAQAVAAKNPHIKVKEIEAEQGLQYTVDALRFLVGMRRNPPTRASARRAAAGGAKRWGQGPHRYIWLMGADNLAGFHHWCGWREIFRLVPIAVFDRAPVSYAALHSPAALAYARFRRNPRNLRDIPAWCYVFMPRHPVSATHLRNTLGNAAFLGHNEP